MRRGGVVMSPPSTDPDLHVSANAMTMEEGRRADIILVTMPFGPLNTPSLALSTLKPLLAEAGYSVSIEYANLRFAELMGEALYQCVADGMPDLRCLAGEFIFCRALFGDAAASTQAYLGLLDRMFPENEDDVRRKMLRLLRRRMEELRGIADTFVHDVAAEIVGRKPRLVGLTSTFQTNTASLALGKAIKAASPDTSVMIGGANCEGPMGARLFREFGFIDCVVTGEAEPIVVEAVRHLTGERECAPRGNAHFRSADAVPHQVHAAVMVHDMNRLPLPDFDEFFASAKGKRIPGGPRLLFETSRGCWWGEKHHCTFCGLNGGTMAFRRKDPVLALSQLEALQERYPGLPISMTDNIMDSGYLRSFVPRLAELGLELDLFYELKANLRKEHVALLARAGIKHVQPGIESFSDCILALMEKGVTGLQNIQLLKWCRQFGVRVAWNFLFGFPDEPEAEYAGMAKLVPKLVHLDPPSGISRLRIDRFSPYFEKASQYFSRLHPLGAYSLVYPLPDDAVSDIAYSFSGDFLDGREPSTYARPVIDALNAWKDNAGRCFLFAIDQGSALMVFDTRGSNGAACELSVLTGADRDILLAADGVKGIASVEQDLQAKYGAAELRKRLDHLERKALIIVNDGKCLALPVCASELYPGRDFWVCMSASSKVANFGLPLTGMSGPKLFSDSSGSIEGNA